MGEYGSGFGIYSSGGGGGGGGGVTSISGVLNRTTITGTAAIPIVDISATYVGQASITTLGTIATGTWNGTTISETNGGTGTATYTQGDILFASAANVLSKLAVGSVGQVLTLAGGVPTWAAASGIGTSFRNVTATTTFATANETINCTANTFTVNLPTAVGIQGTTYTLVNSGSGTITLDGNGMETINDSLTIDLVQYVSRTVQSDGTDWIII